MANRVSTLTTFGGYMLKKRAAEREPVPEPSGKSETEKNTVVHRISGSQQ